MDSSRVGRRCKQGCAVWPDEEEYTLCPACGNATQRFRGLTPLDKEAALSKVRHIEFEEYYATQHPQDVEEHSDIDLRDLCR